MAIQSDKTDDTKATQAKKVYYLACGFCRWSSRDVGIEDKSVGEWKNYMKLGRELQNAVIIHSDKRLTFETSALFPCCSGNLALINLFDTMMIMQEFSMYLKHRS